ncbi:uroporphyrinogen-III C-methyltransferase [Curvivirga aplysinae]|uniref:uroporphyrinogen-III C-methyltransferase n=1 Tax=Curvivirga aplysinae TaxID=2529852 RepID=UPI0012BD3EC7|nr:uroporphyrinogen-III C-methyltransferase [Curvivirga aplysinae]MTI10903.1 uroporphyrinogen-III C-methyltransferase [Curvivirga aplysinae]
MSLTMNITPPADLPEFLPGWVWLVGAGPGDPGLLTLHGVNALAQADVIVYDALVDERILSMAKPEAERIYAGKRGGKPSPKQQDISDRLVELANDGKRVLRLKGGDPFVFGRGGEEALTLVNAEIPFRIVPGITAGIGGMAYAGIPATHRDCNSAVTFVTGHSMTGEVPDNMDWKALANGAPVLIFYMAIKHIGRIVEKLMEAGRPADEPVGFIMAATTENQKVVTCTLETAVETAEQIKPPAIVCVGPVVDLREQLNWMSKVAELSASEAAE